MRRAQWMWLVIGTFLLAGCDDEPAPNDSGVDGDADSDVDGDGDGDVDADGDEDADLPPPETIEEIPIGEEVTMPGLSAPVDAVQDERGFWHVYAETEEDAFRAEGFLMARDRMAQMEVMRRFATGRTAEMWNTFDPSLVADDTASRFMGYARVGELILADLTTEERDLIQAFSDGVTLHIEELRAGTKTLPGSIALSIPYRALNDWEPIDTIAMGRLEVAELSYDGNDDLNRTMELAAYVEAFPADDADPRISARAGAFPDLFTFAPGEKVWVRDGFNNIDEDTGSRAHLPPPRQYLDATKMARVPSVESLEAAKRFLDHIEGGYQRYFGDEWRGSNHWAVHGSKTATGNPMLSSDPHLALVSPPFFWHVHLNTARAGGDLDAAGLAFAGIPVILLGFTQDIGWGSTVHGFDVTDIYLEQITPGDPDTVLFNGDQVPIETITEIIRTDIGNEIPVEFEVVPHHGLIIPGSRNEEGTEALTMRWTGFEPSNELRAFYELMHAANVDEARDALDAFEVGGQNFTMITRDGDIFWSTQIRLPVRDDRALTYDIHTYMGEGPGMLLPGTGEYEWIDNLSDRYLPHDLNPARGFIATANGDAVGVTADGNPFNDEHYLNSWVSLGYRMSRITEVLTELTERGDVTFEEMQVLQHDAISPLGRRFTEPILTELYRAEEELNTPDTHPDLTAAVADIGAENMARVIEARDRLRAWSFDTPAAVEGAPTAEEIADSAAATIFNAMVGQLLELAFGDEHERIGERTSRCIVSLHWSLLQPEEMVTYDPTFGEPYGLGGDTILWDDIRTADLETRGDRILRALDETLTFLEGHFGETMDDWRWGHLHTLTLSSLIPSLGADTISIPTPDDETFPNGFPRHGDRYTVDVSNFSAFATEADQFDYGSGPQQRFTMEMTPDGPVVVNALPAGSALDPDSPHHADETELWRHNNPQPVAFTEEEVVDTYERRIRLTP